MAKQKPLIWQLREWAVTEPIFQTGIDNFAELQTIIEPPAAHQTVKDTVCVAISKIILRKLKPKGNGLRISGYGKITSTNTVFATAAKILSWRNGRGFG